MDPRSQNSKRESPDIDLSTGPHNYLNSEPLISPKAGAILFTGQLYVKRTNRSHEAAPHRELIEVIRGLIALFRPFSGALGAGILFATLDREAH